MELEEFRTKWPDLFFKHGPNVRSFASDTLWANVEQHSLGEYRKWQADLRDHLLLQDDRKICFVVDEEGGAGKSYLAKLLMRDYKCWYSTGGKQADLALSYARPDYVIGIFDLVRNPEDKDFHPYGFAEQLKNGIFFSSKYNSTMRVIQQPRVVWLMNQAPNREKLSADRYCVHIVNKHTV